jgi:hypothetical protein
MLPYPSRKSFFTNLHWLSVDNRRKLGMRRISEAGIEAMAVQIVVDHWRLGRAPATPRHWSRCCATYTVLSNTTGSSSVTVLKHIYILIDIILFEILKKIYIFVQYIKLENILVRRLVLYVQYHIY